MRIEIDDDLLAEAVGQIQEALTENNYRFSRETIQKALGGWLRWNVEHLLGDAREHTLGPDYTGNFLKILRNIKE